MVTQTNMPLNLAALNNIRRIEPPDPLRRHKTLADARHMMQGEQLRDLQIQQQQGQLQDQNKARAENEAAYEILMKHEGNIEAALPELFQKAPQTAMQYQEYAEKQKTARINRDIQARNVSLQNRELLGEQPAPEVNVQAPVATPAPIGTLGGGQYQPPAIGGGQRTVEGPMPAAPVPGIPDLGVAPMNAPMVSPQQKFREMQAATAQKQADEIALIQAREQAQQQFAPPPAPRNIDPNSREGIAARLEFERQRPREPASNNEPLVAIVGANGQSVLVPRSQAVGKQPASTREQGRQVTSGDAGRIADFDTSLDDLVTMRKELTGIGTTGASAKAGAMLPNVVTEVTGIGSQAKQKQAVIDRVKQVIGKALEGGVLRKEDEVKYEKILPTIGDPPAIVKAKLDGLEKAIQQRKQTTLDALDDANYDVTRYRERGAGPKRGTVEDGYVFQGGDPADPNNWKPQ